MSRRSAIYPAKRSMNLCYRPDRTTKPATVALYTLFVLTCLLGLGKLLVYDLWEETAQARKALAEAEEELNDATLGLADYDEVLGRYRRYSATEEERALVDRMEVLALLDKAVGDTAKMEALSISGDAVQLRFSDVTLAQTAGIIHELEASPIVAGTVVNTAATTEETAVGVSAPVQVNAVIYLQKEAAE